MKWKDGLFLLASAFVWSVSILAALHYEGDPDWLGNLPAVPGSDGILWQVQTTFLSVGFAGLAIAAQLFAETPLAIGASRSRVLEYVHAVWFVGVGLTANAVIAVETIWLPSHMGALGVTIVWFVPTVALLVLSYFRLMRLFGHPSRLDEVVRVSLIEALTSRMETVSRDYGGALRPLDSLFDAGFSVGGFGSSAVTLRVPVPRVGLVVKAIKPQVVRRAIASLGPRLTEGGAVDGENDGLYTPPQLTLEIEPGDRTRIGETAFRVRTAQELDQGDQDQLVRLLQSSIEFEPPGSVTPYEETNREIAILKDTVGTSLRSGAYGTAERALELLGQVVRGVWTAQPEISDSSRRSSFTRRDWLYHSIGEVEQDAMLSPRACELFVGQAMTRALEAPRTGSMEYVEECLRSFTRIWFETLRSGDSQFDSVPSHIVTCVQNLAEYSFATAEQRDDLQARATWVMVELVKLALDGKAPETARLAARELDGLFEFADSGGSGRSNVKAGQLVLSGWLDYLAEKRDSRDPGDLNLRELVTPRGTWSEILAARVLAERGTTPFSRWNLWEMRTSGSSRAQLLELPHYIDRAVLAALASSYGPLPPATDQEAASEYRRFLRLLEEESRELSTRELMLKQKLSDEVGKWDAAEVERLAQEPLSQSRIDVLRNSLRETLDARQGLAAEIPIVTNVPESADKSRPILGMNFRVPRRYLVDKVFNQTYADPKELGNVIARGFVEGEERKIVEELRSQQNDLLVPTAQAIRREIASLRDEAEHYVLVTPYGGLMDDHDWYSTDFRQALARVTHIETGGLDGEAVLFDRRSTLALCRKPEEKDGLMPVEGTSIAVGVFEDVEGQDEPQVRIETGEYFTVWAGDEPKIHWFASPPDTDAAGTEMTDDAGDASLYRG
ncbi:hypothetical protein FNU77_04260 [Prescottella equi]|uniref:hypothetical protein n=1 Tax=Rhodococcus hoagii TaxID=43767 RepID=UPI000A104D0B|nr:hypothetical protein [Prescottella equi]ORL92520.1 hypothetical protein A5N69_20055 [Prescottella equi]ORM15068.1 hypothetical protein A5N74_22015 [Prescottella equi]QDP08998.1 hypothetical protein FNU77_04260 [Prescottella equi]